MQEGFKILSLRLENFQGVKEFEFKPGGESASIYGDNGTGKTTLYNAFCWLIYGKPSTAEKNFSPQTVGTHGLEHSAEMEIEVGDKKRLLGKTFKEVYKTKRGSADKLFSGYTTDFYIDGVPVREKEYMEVVSGIVGDLDTAKMLTRYNYFLEEIPIKTRRAILLDMCGDAESLVQAVMEDPELKDLPGILEGREIPDFIKIAAAKKKKIDDELKQIPGRIDEAEKAKPDISGMSKDGIEMALKNLQAEREGLTEKKGALNSTAEGDARKRISGIEAAISEAKAMHVKDQAEANKSIMEKMMEKESEVSAALKKVRSQKDKIAELEDSLKRLNRMREGLLEEWKEAFEKTWTGSTICPTCGQPMPEEKIEEAKRKFNLEKSKTLEDINERGRKCNKDIIAEREKDIEEAKAELEKRKSGYAAIEAQRNEVAGQVVDVAFESTPKYKELMADLNAAKDSLKDLEGAKAAANADVDAKIADLDAIITETQKKLSFFDITQAQKERIKELEERQRKLAAEFEEVDRALYLCGLYQRRKAELLNSKVNCLFNTLEFRLFTEQINGGIADDCEALIPCGDRLIPFKSANNAARINAGLETIEVLGEHFGTTMPIWIDNCESVTAPIETKAQQIRLYVSEADKELRVDG